MIRVITRLSVKELAARLGRGPGYVYRMRQAGFTMQWDEKTRCLVTTEHKARVWIVKNNFRVIRGKASLYQ